MLATTRVHNGKLELVVAGLVLAVEGGYLHDAQLVERYKLAERAEGIPGSGRYWTPVLLKAAAVIINTTEPGKTAEQDAAKELRRAYLDKRKKE